MKNTNKSHVVNKLYVWNNCPYRSEVIQIEKPKNTAQKLPIDPKTKNRHQNVY